MGDETLKNYAYVNIISYWVKIFNVFSNCMDSEIGTNHISKVSAELRARELVEGIYPEIGNY